MSSRQGYRRGGRKVGGAGLLLTWLLGCSLTGLAVELQPPARQLKTPVSGKLLDPAVYASWVEGREEKIAGSGRESAPEWVLWSQDSQQPGHSGVRFGAQSKEAGPRHLRIGFKQAIPVGSVLTLGGGKLSVLKSNAAYPGRLDQEADWLPAQRLLADGSVTDKQAGRGELSLWVLPPGTTTRALRFTHVSEFSDTDPSGWLGGAAVLPGRWLNVAPYAAVVTESEAKNAGRIVNLNNEVWDAWANMASRLKNPKRQPVSVKDPEVVTLIWPEEVTLNGLIGLMAGVGSVEIDRYTGPADRHPREAQSKDWTAVPAANFSKLESGYPVPLWPNYLPFAAPVKTRALRLRLTGVAPESHPHIVGNTNEGRRVWLGELMAVRALAAQEELAAPEFTKREKETLHPPIPVRFTLPEPGYVTLVIEDADGMRVRNLVSETWFPAGENVAWWDGSDDLGRDLDAARHGLYQIPVQPVKPGTYTARGLWHKGVKPFYEFSLYSTGTPPWNTADHTGAWLANHSAPSAAAFVPAERSPFGEPAVFLGCYVTEGPDGLAWVDLTGRKRGGMKWIGGTWTAAPFLASDRGPQADPKVAVYVGAAWTTDTKKGTQELRLNAVNRDGRGTREILKTTLGPRTDGTAADELGGIAAWNGTLACALPRENAVWLINTADGKIVNKLAVPAPKAVAYGPDGRLYVLSGGKLLQLENGKSRVVIGSGLEEPVALTLDEAGNFYLSDRGKSHQVKVFSPAGRLLRTVGEPGALQVGRYNERKLNNPAGLAVDSQGRLWVTEEDFLPKRVSVWDRNGKLLQAFYGPGKYGGGGMLDNHRPDRFYYADEGRGSMEFAVDWKTGRDKLINVLFRSGETAFELPSRSSAPEAALYHGGKRYFTNCYSSDPVAGSNSAFLFLERDGVARPVAGMGVANDWPYLQREEFKSLWPAGVNPERSRWENNGRNVAFYVWNDTNADGLVQPAEVKMTQNSCSGVTVMEDLSFCVANLDGRAMRFRPQWTGKTGYPVYDGARGEVLAEGVYLSGSTGGNQLLADDSDWAIVTAGVKPFHQYSLCGLRDGKAVWSYPSPWPGLHASHEAAQPDRPGQVIGSTRLLGGFVQPKGSQVEPLWAVNGNMGNLYLFTRDGLFVSTVFRDVRQGKLWRMPQGRRNMSLEGISLHDENFWPSISQTPDGVIHLIDGANTSVVRLDGLETLRPLPPVKVTVTPEALQQAQAIRLQQEAIRQREAGRGTLRVASLPGVQVDGKFDDWSGVATVDIDKRGVAANFNSDSKPYDITGALAVRGDRLYAMWDTKLKDLLRNSGEQPLALFKTGGALDLMLSTDPAAPADRRQPVAGDLRLLVTKVGGKTRALLYQPVVPGAAADQKVPFSSPWRTITFDRVLEVSNQVELAEDGQGRFELSVPLAVLGLKPKAGLRLKGDLGVLRGNGTETSARSYWSNKATAITADVPSEAELQPALWGEVVFE